VKTKGASESNKRLRSTSFHAAIFVGAAAVLIAGGVGTGAKNSLSEIPNRH
jgi:hypothetical protein